MLQAFFLVLFGLYFIGRDLNVITNGVLEELNRVGKMPELQIIEVNKRIKLDDKKKPLYDYEKKKYYCGYCDCRFTMDVTTVGSGLDELQQKICRISTQVKCPRCGNFLKTW